MSLTPCARGKHYLDDDFSQVEMILGLAQQVVQEGFKTEVQKLDEELDAR